MYSLFCGCSLSLLAFLALAVGASWLLTSRAHELAAGISTLAPENEWLWANNTNSAGLNATLRFQFKTVHNWPQVLFQNETPRTVLGPALIFNKTSEYYNISYNESSASMAYS